MENSEKQRFVESAFHALRTRGVVSTYQDFARLIGVSKNTLSAAKNGNETYLTESLMAKIQSALEYHTSPSDTPSDQESILVIPTGARAGTLADFSTSASAYDCEKIISPIKGADYAIQVTGDSMSPEYPSGSMILIKKINEKAFIEWGKVYVLDTENGAVIKTVRKTDDPEVIECISTNPAYQPFTMETKYINGWYRVLMVLSLK